MPTARKTVKSVKKPVKSAEYSGPGFLQTLWILYSIPCMIMLAIVTGPNLEFTLLGGISLVLVLYGFWPLVFITIIVWFIRCLFSVY